MDESRLRYTMSVRIELQNLNLSLLDMVDGTATKSLEF